jgi:hypothetical protein
MKPHQHALRALGLLALLPTAGVYAAGGNPPVDPCASRSFATYAEIPELPVDPEVPVDPGIPGCPGDGEEKPPRADTPDLTPPSFARTRRISKTFIIDRPGVYDFGNELIEWAGPEKCKPQKDGVPAVLIRSSNVTIKNLGISGSPGGIQVTGVNVALENVTAWSCGQAMSVMGDAGRFSIKNSHFYGNPEFADRLLSVSAGNFIVENTLFSDAEVCLQFGGGQDAKITSSDFVGCKTAILGNTSNNQRFSTMETIQNESWFSDIFLHLVGHVRGTSRSDLAYDGAKKKLEKDAHLIEN